MFKNEDSLHTDKIFTSHISDNGLVFRTDKEYAELNKKGKYTISGQRKSG